MTLTIFGIDNLEQLRKEITAFDLFLVGCIDIQEFKQRIESLFIKKVMFLKETL